MALFFLGWKMLKDGTRLDIWIYLDNFLEIEVTVQFM